MSSTGRENEVSLSTLPTTQVGASPKAPVGRQRERVGEDPGLLPAGDLGLVVQPARFPHLANGTFLRELQESGAQEVLSTANRQQ